MLSRALLIMGIFIFCMGFVYFLMTGDMSNARFAMAAGGVYIAFSYGVKEYPKISRILFIIFSVIFGLAIVMFVVANFT